MVESVLGSRELLYLFKMNGCSACEAGLAELTRFQVKHPGMMILIFDASGPYPDRLGLTIKATPTYAFRRGDEMIARSGMMKVAELEKWIKGMGGSL